MTASLWTIPLLPKLVSLAASLMRSTIATARPRAWSASAAETPTNPEPSTITSIVCDGTWKASPSAAPGASILDARSYRPRGEWFPTRAHSHDPALFPPRDDRGLVARDALSHLVRDRGSRLRRAGRDRRDPEGGGQGHLGERRKGRVRRRAHRRDREGRQARRHRVPDPSRRIHRPRFPFRPP